MLLNKPLTAECFIHASAFWSVAALSALHLRNGCAKCGSFICVCLIDDRDVLFALLFCAANAAPSEAAPDS